MHSTQPNSFGDGKVIEQLLQTVEDLKQQLILQRQINSEISTKISRLEGSLKTTPLAESGLNKKEMSTTRRRMLKRLGVAVSGAAIVTTLAQTGKAEAAGGTGNFSFNGIGQPGATAQGFNQSSGTTTISSNVTKSGPGTASLEIVNDLTSGAKDGLISQTIGSSSGVAITGITQNALAAGVRGTTGLQASGAFDAGDTSTVGGVTGTTDSANGVFGISSSLIGGAGVYGISLQGIGVIGKGINTYGGSFRTSKANTAQLYIKPSTTATPSSTGSNQIGEIFVDNQGRVWVFSNETLPASWRQLTAPATSGTFQFLPSPDRFVATNTGIGVGSNPGSLQGFYPSFTPTTPAQTKTYKLTGVAGVGGQTIPTSARAVAGIVTIGCLDLTTVTGFVVIYPTGQAFPSVATMNYSKSPVFTSSFFISALGTNGQVNVAARNNANLFIDLVGYIT